MSATELPMASAPTTAAPSATSAAAAVPVRDEHWQRAAKRARQLSWASLAWMSIEGIVGLIAGFEANSLSLLIWAASSFVEGLASMTIIWRFTGSRMHSDTSERTAQKWVAGSFLLLVPYFLYESFDRLLNGSDTEFSGLGAAVTISAIVLMPLLGWAKLRLSRQLGSDATAGEGVQNILCAAQAAAVLVALIGAGAGLAILDPIAAFVISAIAIKECAALWRGESDDCCAPVGFGDPAAPADASCTSETSGNSCCAPAATSVPSAVADAQDHCCTDDCCTPAADEPKSSTLLPVAAASGEDCCDEGCCSDEKRGPFSRSSSSGSGRRP